MSSEEILIETVNDLSTEQADGQTLVKAVNAKAIADNLNKLISLVQQLDLTSQGGLELDEVAIATKISANGEVILLNGNPGGGNGAIVLKFKRSIPPSSSPAIATRLSLQEEFRSATGIEYSRLNTMLAEGHWQKANQETWDLMCEALSKSKGSYLSAAEIKQLPCEDIRTIDRLWQKHSQGRFGFTSQHQAYNAAMTEK
jgi:GUN4-like